MKNFESKQAKRATKAARADLKSKYATRPTIAQDQSETPKAKQSPHMARAERTQVLITSGCSFSETLVEETWPIHLHRMLVNETAFCPSQHISLGLGSQGNGLISRKVIHAVHEELKVKEAEDILVGIMWSSPSRHEQYSCDRDEILRLKHGSNKDQWMDNPTSVVEKDIAGGWILYNSHWTIPQAKNYYRNVYNETYSMIQTLEHIIRVQNYLKVHNVNYCMGVYTGEVLRLHKNVTSEWPGCHVMTEHPSLVHLYEQIDFDQFFDTNGEMEFAKASDLPNLKGDHHPSSDQHKLFCQEVIIPHLKSKINI